MSSLRYLNHLNGFERPNLQPWRREGLICLDKNEAPFSPLESLPNFFEDLKNQFARTYPDPFPLYEKLSAFTGASTHQLLLTFGSEQAIRFCYELMIGPGDEVVCLHPTFAMIDVFNRTFQAKTKIIDFKNSLSLTIESLLDGISKDTKLLVLPNPNNPTGSQFSLNELEKIANNLKDVGALFVVDEAYFHYSNITAQPLIERYDNVLVTRTFSKGWGLAGIRVGYIVAQKSLIQLLRKLKPIDEVSTFSLQAALSALEHPELLKKNVDQVHQWQNNFRNLQKPSLNYHETFANFILLGMTEENHKKATQWFKENKILVKTEFGHEAFTNKIRFSVTNDSVMSEIFSYFENQKPTL